MKDGPNTDEPKCNCKGNSKEPCPLKGNCQAKAIIYKATVTTKDGKEMDYYGLCETPFKLRYGNHKHALNNKSSTHHTKLSEYVWKLTGKKKEYAIKWKIAERSNVLPKRVEKVQFMLLGKTRDSTRGKKQNA